jgi:predicted amidohydrolase
MIVRVAAIQLALGKASYRKAVDDAIALIQHARNEGAQIVCLPEHWLLEYGELGYNAAQELADTAKANRVYLITGANYTPVERNGGSRELRIRSILLSPEGQMIGEQDKVHLFHGEKNTATAGEAYRTFPTSLGNVGIIVCYDNVFPETARTLTLKGADLLFVPSRIIADGLDPWILYLRARSLENRIPVIAPNVFDPPRYVGGSVIVDLEMDSASGVVRPKIVASAKNGESLITADVNVDLARELRRERFGDRRPEAYSNLVFIERS